MTYLSPTALVAEPLSQTRANPAGNPRQVMHERLPGLVQPLLTWLTAQTAPGEPVIERSPLYFVAVALLQTVLGAALSAVALHLCPPLVLVGMLVTTSGLGLFQVVIFHHCSHGTVFKRRDPDKRDLNILVGRLISALLLFKHFDRYKHGHMLHHSNNKLLTEEDEFADFVFNTCRLEAGTPHEVLRRRVLLSLVSPRFHARFLVRRLRAAWLSHDRTHNLIGLGTWAALAAAALVSGQVPAFLVALVLPVTVLLQVATVGRILCEHCFPDVELISSRGKDFTSHATAGVFPGAPPPAAKASSARGLALWLGWWANMLTVQLLVRVFVMVGDAPCHDYHHRKPASRRWTSYIQARQQDVEAAAAGPRVGYSEVWGLFRAVDITLASLSRLPPGTTL